MADNIVSLTKREMELVKLMATGATIKEMALALYISTCTVKTHTGNIYRKLHVCSRVTCVMLALREGWIDLGQEEPSHGE